MNIAVVGATGMVGREMIKVLEERNFPVNTLIPVATKNSAGKKVEFLDKEYTIVTVDQALEMDIDIAIFSAGGDFSKIYAPKFASKGIRVIDNSSVWRMDPNIKLVVPEINGHIITNDDMIIANPNCSTIQLVMVLWPLHKKFGIKRVVVSTYQSITGTGKKAVEQLNGERKGEVETMAYPHPIDQNCIPHCDDFYENGYTKEEMKLVNESRKIMSLPNLKLTATAVRVPVIGGHSESVNVSFENPPVLGEIKTILNDSVGVVVQDNPSSNLYPMPISAHGEDDVFVGRIRMDESEENAINMWIVSDNLRKGAATNSVQIAEHLVNSAIVA